MVKVGTAGGASLGVRTPLEALTQWRALMESIQLPYHWPRTGAEQPLAGSAG